MQFVSDKENGGATGSNSENVIQNSNKGSSSSENDNDTQTQVVRRCVVESFPL